MKVLVACERSGLVRDAFACTGHAAWSCDLEPSESPGQHYVGDVRKILAGNDWDLLVAHPPCTHLAVSGAHRFEEKRRDGRQLAALEFVAELMDADIPRIAIENPVSIISTTIRKPDQIIQPWMFGHGDTKATCLWLKNLPKLTPTKVVSGRHPATITHSSKGKGARNRSKTYPGIAYAMADQWGAAA